MSVRDDEFMQARVIHSYTMSVQEVCEGQAQFARRTSGRKQIPLPEFGGAHGGDVASQLLSIQATSSTPSFDDSSPVYHQVRHYDWRS